MDYLKYKNLFNCSIYHLNQNYNFSKNYILNIFSNKDLSDAYNNISKWKDYKPTPLIELNKLAKLTGCEAMELDVRNKESLKELENIEFDSLNYQSAQHIHFVSEAERRAYADRAEFMGDMDFVPVPIDTLISDEYAYHRWQSVDSLNASLSADIVHCKKTFNYP